MSSSSMSTWWHRCYRAVSLRPSHAGRRSARGRPRSHPRRPPDARSSPSARTDAHGRSRAARVSPVDPPDLRLWPTLRHLFPLWWAQRRLVLIGLLLRARVHRRSRSLIPVLIQRTIDDAIDTATTARCSARTWRDPGRRRRSASSSTITAATRPRASASPSRRACAQMLYEAYLALSRARSTTGTRPAR